MLFAKTTIGVMHRALLLVLGLLAVVVAVDTSNNDPVIHPPTVHHRGRRRLAPAALECFLYRVHIQYLDHTTEEKWQCELQGADAAMAGLIFVDVEGLDFGDFDVGGAPGAAITLLAEGAVIQNGTLKILKGATQRFNKVERRGPADKADENGTSQQMQQDRRGLAPIMGTRTVLAVRVIAPDATTTSTTAEISDKMFGTSVDICNLKERMQTCSYDEVMIQPFSGTVNGKSISYGIYEVTISSNVIGQDKYDVQNAVVTKLISELGPLPNPLFNHVVLCLPPGTNGDWNGYGYYNYYLAVFNNEKCNYPSGQVHEVGHNFGLRHATDAGVEYGDQTGLMGYSYLDDTTWMCFNPAKSWQLGWYSLRRLSLDLANQGPVTVDLIGIVDYQHTGANGKYVTVQVVPPVPGAPAIYVGFNLQAGFNNETKEAQNQVTVTSQPVDNKSQLLAKLSSGQQHTVNNFWYGDSLVIKVNSLSTIGNPPTANVDVFLNGCSSHADCTDGDACLVGTCGTYGTCSYSWIGTTCPGSFTIDLTTDDYPQQTSWKVQDLCNASAIVLFGGPYASTDKRTHFVSSEILGKSRFRLTFSDSNGDGLAVGIDGSFTATFDGLPVAVGIGDFGSNVVREFGTTCQIPSSKPSLQPSDMPSLHPSVQPSSSSQQPSSNPSLQPSSSSQRPSSQPSDMPHSKPSLQPSSSSQQPSSHPSLQPSSSSQRPSSQPSDMPNSKPSLQPSSSSQQPSSNPSLQPSSSSQRPSSQPSDMPHSKPSLQPSEMPSSHPSLQPSSSSQRPSSHPSLQPSSVSKQPSSQPSLQPSDMPSSHPSLRPSSSSQPSKMPSTHPSLQPSEMPSLHPSLELSEMPSSHPSLELSETPSTHPSLQLSAMPSSRPSLQPSEMPSSHPSLHPSEMPSSHPTLQPSEMPSSQPSLQPSRSQQPSSQPILHPSEMPSSQPSLRPSEVTLPPETTWQLIFADDFEAGFDEFKSGGGKECKISSSLAYEGTNSLEVNNGKSGSYAYTVSSYAVSAFTKVRVSFVYYTQNVDDNEKFYLEWNSNLNANYVPVATFNFGTTYTVNKMWLNASVEWNVDGASQVNLRLRSKFSEDKEKVNFDSFVFEGWPSAASTPAPFTPAPIKMPSSRPSLQPSAMPSSHPSLHPSEMPSSHPTLQPSEMPSSQPSLQPSRSQQPSSQPILHPSEMPSSQPSLRPSEVTLPPETTWQLIFADDFEAGFDEFKSGGGKECKISSSLAYEGTNSLEVNNGKSGSYAYTVSSYAVSAFTKVRVSFVYYTQNVDDNEKFYVEWNSNLNANYVPVATFNFGTTYTVNKVWLNASVEWNVDGASQASLRLRSKFSEDKEKVNFDSFVFEGFVGASGSSAFVP